MNVMNRSFSLRRKRRKGMRSAAYKHQVCLLL